MTRPGYPPVRTRADVLRQVQLAVEKNRGKISPAVNVLTFTFYRELPHDQQPSIALEAKQFGVAYNTMKSWREKYERDEKE